jgi:Flp pilus assembly protein TadG
MHWSQIVQRAKDSRGQSLVEFALVCVGLVALLFGVVEMCRLLLVWNTVTNAARVGVRYATVHGSDNSVTATTIQGIVDNYLAAATVPTGSATTYVCYASSVAASSSGCTSNTGSASSSGPGSVVTVSVSYPYSPLTGYFPLSVNLASSSQGVIAF